jgi:outer membrane protein assembly factor BamB
VLYVGSGDDHVYALDAATGDMLWRVATGGFRRFPTAPAVANGVVYFGVWSAGGLYALDAATGAQLLRFAHVKTVGAAPVDDGVVYVASDSGTLWALDLTGPAGPNGSGLTRRGGGADAIG